MLKSHTTKLEIDSVDSSNSEAVQEIDDSVVLEAFEYSGDEHEP